MVELIPGKGRSEKFWKIKLRVKPILLERMNTSGERLKFHLNKKLEKEIHSKENYTFIVDYRNKAWLELIWSTFHNIKAYIYSIWIAYSQYVKKKQKLFFTREYHFNLFPQKLKSS